MQQLYNIFSEHERFIHRYIPMSREMYAMAFRILQIQEEAEDVVQDVLLTLYERRRSLPPEAAEIGYVMAMVRNRCIDRLRALSTQPLAPPGEEVSSGSEPLTASPEEQIEARDYLEHLLQSLPEKARLIVQLRLIDDLSFEEIEQQTGISQGNARVILSRAMKEIKAKKTK